MPPRTAVVLVGKPTSEFVRIEVVRRLFPDAGDKWDANALSVRVEVRVGGFLGNVDGDVFANEVVTFQQKVRPCTRL